MPVPGTKSCHICGGANAPTAVICQWCRNLLIQPK